MLYILKTETMWGAGGRTSHTKMIGKSDSKIKCKNLLKKEFNKALKDKNVEFINQCEMDSIDNDFDFGDSLEIQYESDGFNCTAVEFTIVSDKFAREL